MVTKTQALELVRKELASNPEFVKMAPSYLIRTMYEYNNEYHFVISPNNVFVLDDPTVFEEIVNSKIGNIRTTNPMTVTSDLMSDGIIGMIKIRKYINVVKASEPVDLTDEQWEELKRHMDQF